MFYILNETGQIIAADEMLLSHCGVSDVSGLSSKVSVGDTTFTSQDENSVTITTNGGEETFSSSKTSLSSTLGNMTLISLGEALEADKVSDEPFILETLDDLQEDKVETIDFGDEISFDLPTEEPSDTLESDTLEIEEEITFGTPSESDEPELFEIMDSVEDEVVQEPETVSTDSDELFTLIDDESNVSDESVEDTGEIVVDVAHNSEDIGISDEDYAAFLHEYIDTALALEEDLQNDDMNIRNRAIDTLTDLSEVMRITEISAIMQKINSSTPEQQKGYMGSLYTTLSRLTTQSSTQAAEEETLETATTTEEVEKVLSPNSFGTIDLSEVKPKHFDFQLEEAANDLSLPVELIEEFVHDFIEQAHVETKKMLEAYEEGDLPKIQAIGHLLKGASSNLRINALSDTLYKIQFCESEDGLDDLIKDYWAHFLSFETQINVISN